MGKDHVTTGYEEPNDCNSLTDKRLAESCNNVDHRIEKCMLYWSTVKLARQDYVTNSNKSPLIKGSINSTETRSFDRSFHSKTSLTDAFP